MPKRKSKVGVGMDDGDAPVTKRVAENTPSSKDESLLLQQLNDAFLVHHPRELVEFYRWAQHLNPSAPLEAFESLNSLKLVGPFSFLLQEKEGSASTNWLTHSRHPTDLPEMETLLTYDAGRFCYWRDLPTDSSPYLIHVASQPDNFPSMEIVGGVSPFAALHFLQKKHPRLKENIIKGGLLPPTRLDKLNSSSYEKAVGELKRKRKKESIGEPFHGLGIRVDLTKGDVGYRPVDCDLKKFKQQLVTLGTSTDDTLKEKTRQELFELFTYVQIANDELDFGMGLEFGHDLYISNYPCFDGMARSVLKTAYELLGREEFSTIIDAQFEEGRRQ